MLKQLAMPTRQEVAQALLKAIIRHGGAIREFSANESIVDELAADCNLNESQRAAFLETIYRKENRRKRSKLWHRLLFRAADSLAKEQLITRPSETLRLTGIKEWMLTEKGFDQALALSNISSSRKEYLTTKSFEVEKVVLKLFEATPPKKYNPIDPAKKIITISRDSALRLRGFRQAVIQAYDHRCAVCGFTLSSPDNIAWEVQAAHIVPNGFLGRDDVWNGIALCHLHHWCFDVGWFTLCYNHTIELSPIVVHCLLNRQNSAVATSLPLSAVAREELRCHRTKIFVLIELLSSGTAKMYFNQIRSADMSYNPQKIVYSINNSDLQSVALDVIERKLNEKELKIVAEKLGDFIQWHEAVSYTISACVDSPEQGEKPVV